MRWAFVAHFTGEETEVQRGGERTQDYTVNKWQEEDSNPSLAWLQRPCLKCQQVLRPCQRNAQGHALGWSGRASWRLWCQEGLWGAVKHEDHVRSQRTGVPAWTHVTPWPYGLGQVPGPWCFLSGVFKGPGFTNQAETVVWAVSLAGERVWSFPAPAKNWTHKPSLAHPTPNLWG